MSYPPPPNPPQYPPPGQWPAAPPGRLRGRTPLRLGILFLVVGIVLIVAGGVILGKNSFGAVNDFERVNIAARTGTIHFNSAGSYLAYYEAPDVTSATRKVPLPLIALRAPSGTTLSLDTLYGGASRSSLKIKYLSYQYNGHNGIAIYQFKITEKGAYGVQLAATGNAAAGADIAFGKSIAKGIGVGVALILPGVLLLIAGIVLLIVGLVKRSRHKKQLAAGHHSGGASGQWPQPPAAPTGQWPQPPPPGGQWPQPPPPGGQWPAPQGS